MLAARLTAEGHGAEPAALRLADEARILEALLGGSVGSAGSDSLGETPGTSEARVLADQDRLTEEKAYSGDAALDQSSLPAARRAGHRLVMRTDSPDPTNGFPGRQQCLNSAN